jgi:hypothetical protein
MRLLKQSSACKLFAAPITKSLSMPAETEDPDVRPAGASSQGWAEQAVGAKSTLIIILCSKV